MSMARDDPEALKRRYARPRSETNVLPALAYDLGDAANLHKVRPRCAIRRRVFRTSLLNSKSWHTVRSCIALEALLGMHGTAWGCMQAVSSK